MPCIQTTVNIPLEKNQQQLLREKLGKAIAIIPGKSEQWLMLTFHTDCTMFFSRKKRRTHGLCRGKNFRKSYRPFL